MELDHSTREDAYAILADGQLALPRSFVLASTERMWWRCGATVMARPVEHCQSLTLITAMKRAKCAEGSAPIGWIFRELYAAIAFKLRAVCHSRPRHARARAVRVPQLHRGHRGGHRRTGTCISFFLFLFCGVVDSFFFNRFACSFRRCAPRSSSRADRSTARR